MSRLFCVIIFLILTVLGNGCPPSADISQVDHCQSFEINETTLDRLVKCRCWYGDLLLKGKFLKDDVFQQRDKPVLTQIFGKLILNRTKLTELPFLELTEINGLEITVNYKLRSLGHSFKINGDVNINQVTRLCHPNPFISKLRERGTFEDNRKFCEGTCSGGEVTPDFLKDLPPSCKLIEGDLKILNWNGPTTKLFKLDSVKEIKGTVVIQKTSLMNLDFLEGLSRISCGDQVCLTISDNPRLQSIGLKSLRQVRTKGAVAILIERNEALRLKESEAKALSLKASPAKAVVRDAVVEKEEKSNQTAIIVTTVVIICGHVLVVIIVAVVCRYSRKNKAQKEKSQSMNSQPTAPSQKKEDADLKSAEKSESKKSTKSKQLSAESNPSTEIVIDD